MKVDFDAMLADGINLKGIGERLAQYAKSMGAGKDSSADAEPDPMDSAEPSEGEPQDMGGLPNPDMEDKGKKKAALIIALGKKLGK